MKPWMDNIYECSCNRKTLYLLPLLSFFYKWLSLIFIFKHQNGQTSKLMHFFSFFPGPEIQSKLLRRELLETRTSERSCWLLLWVIICRWLYVKVLFVISWAEDCRGERVTGRLEWPLSLLAGGLEVIFLCACLHKWLNQHSYWGNVKKSFILEPLELPRFNYICTFFMLWTVDRFLRPVWRTVAIASMFWWRRRSLFKEYWSVPFCPNITPPLPSMTGCWASYRYVDGPTDTKFKMLVIFFNNLLNMCINARKWNNQSYRWSLICLFCRTNSSKPKDIHF